MNAYRKSNPKKEIVLRHCIVFPLVFRNDWPIFIHYRNLKTILML